MKGQYAYQCLLDKSVHMSALFFFNVIEIQEERYKRSAAVTQLMKRLIEQGESIKQQLRTLR